MTSSWIRQFAVARRAISAAMMALLGVAALSAVAAQSPEATTSSVDQSTPLPPSDGSDGAIIEVPGEPVIIESDAPQPEPTLDQLVQKFRDALAQPPSYIMSERQLAGGLLEIHTRFGRLCARALPGRVQSGLGGDIVLASPCAAF